MRKAFFVALIFITSITVASATDRTIWYPQQTTTSTGLNQQASGSHAAERSKPGLCRYAIRGRYAGAAAMPNPRSDARNATRILGTEQLSRDRHQARSS
jgi:hypothetical protein